MTHAAVLDLEKAYDNVDRHLFLEIVEWQLDAETTAMVRALLKSFDIRAKNDPTEYVAKVTRGVLQGAPSSPVLINMSIDPFASAADASEHV